MHIRCPRCKRRVATNTPWVCGFCKVENLRADQFPFTQPCGKCGARPKAYKCHYRDCGHIIFLSDDEQEANYAYCLNTEVPPLKEDKRAVRADAKESIAHEIEMMELASKLNAAKQKADFMKPKSARDEIQESYEKHHAAYMGTREFARRQRAINAEKYKDDPEMLKYANDQLEAWEKSRL